ncbi:MAG: tetratricopeptide (TPR) repeat protein [Bacteroidia bacterium]|jgi:tetratricopeptide (TPR) repeat protein
MIKALILTCALALSSTAQQPNDFSVSASYENGETLISVRAKDMRVSNVIDAIGTSVGLEVLGFDANKIQPLVTISLERRPLDMALEFVLGSCGLSFERAGNSIRVQDYDPTDKQEMLLAAKVAYAGAVRSFPDSDHAPAAHLAQGWIEEQGGNLATAIKMYQLVPEKYPMFPEVADAHFHTARINEKLGNWRDAVQSYDNLKNMSIDHGFHSAQRIGRARCDVELGMPQEAMYKIEVLNMERPTADPSERSKRFLVLARAHNGLRDYGQALRDLDAIAQLRSGIVSTEEYIRTTAIALEGMKMYGPAAQAWLAYARMVDGQARLTAIEMAVELYLDEGDEVSAIHALRFGEDVGLSAKLTNLRAVVDERLGLDLIKAGDVTDPAKRIELAQLSYNSGDSVAAYREISSLTDRHGDLAEETRVKLYSLWSRCTADIEGHTSAITLMRELRKNLTALENRSQLDLVAAELYEDAGMFDEAVDAYGGIYR